MTTTTAEHPLAIALSAAVPLRIVELKSRGGPQESDWHAVRDFAPMLASKGDTLQYGGKGDSEGAGELLRLDGVSDAD